MGGGGEQATASATAMRGKVLHSHPSQKREGWGTRAFVAG